MKIVLSRKGFDSTSGGYPSPILPDGTLLSMPIPDKSTNIKYSDLTMGSDSYLDILNALLKGNVKLESEKINLSDNPECHFDPDIRAESYERLKSWKGLFGQIGSAQTHLVNNNVGVGDIFLYFGWFRKTIYVNGKLKFDPNDKNDKNGRHILYGYLEVGEIIQMNSETKIDKWMKYHPHCQKNGLENNMLYVASDRLTLDNSMSGYGTFNYSDELVLTKANESRSKWDLPEIFKECSISYHNKDNWKGDYFQSVARGQEFVVSENLIVTEWARNIIQKNGEFK